jgi:hypothetical protein
MRETRSSTSITTRRSLLDAHQNAQWLVPFGDDADYFMPIRRTRVQRELGNEFAQLGEMTRA